MSLDCHHGHLGMTLALLPLSIHTLGLAASFHPTVVTSDLGHEVNVNSLRDCRQSKDIILAPLHHYTVKTTFALNPSFTKTI